MVISRRVQTVFRSTSWKALLPLFYFAALFPSRNHWDTVEILRLSRNGQSLDQWTAIYFRYLEWLSIGGRFAFIASLIGLIGLSYSTCYFIDSLPVSSKASEVTKLLALASPYVGVFGMTLTHEVQTTTGALVLSGVLLRRGLGQETNLPKSLLFIAILYCTMTFVGNLIVIGYLLSTMTSARKVRTVLSILLVIFFALFSSSLLRVEKVSSGTNLQSILGDIRCITQHKDSNISSEDWITLESFGPKELWQEPKTCSYSDSVFAFSQVQGREIELVKLWMEMVRHNPQIALQARIQRSTIALPPPFFQSQPNYSSRDYLEPVGVGTQDDLQQWSPLFKTSNDDAYQMENFPSPQVLKPLEFVALLPAFIFNSQSWFWGWGGLWFLVFSVLLLARTHLTYKGILKIQIPHILTIFGLFAGSPISDPRYAMTLTTVGIFSGLGFLVDYLVKRKSIP